MATGECVDAAINLYALRSNAQLAVSPREGEWGRDGNPFLAGLARPPHDSSATAANRSR